MFRAKEKDLQYKTYLFGASASTSGSAAASSDSEDVDEADDGLESLMISSETYFFGFSFDLVEDLVEDFAISAQCAFICDILGLLRRIDLSPALLQERRGDVSADSIWARFVWENI